MVKVFFHRNNDEVLETDIEEGKTLLDAALRLHVKEIPADCKGNCACGTCHIHIDSRWVDIVEPIDLASLEPFVLEKCSNYDEKLSRLCCQVEIKESYNGLTVNLLVSDIK